ncbi:MAG: radical SAM protein, partial [Nanobdellota archaeon]
GCNNKCAYCGFKKNVCRKEKYEVTEEIEKITKYYKTKNFYFLNTDIAKDINYSNFIISRLKQLDLKWGDTANLSSLNPQIIKEFSQAGCIELFCGFTTASMKLHSYLNRRPIERPFSHYSNCFKKAHESGIWITTDVMSGIPYETWADVLATGKFMEINARFIDGIFHNRFYMMRNSPFSKYPNKFGLKLNHNYNIKTKQHQNIPNLTEINFSESNNENPSIIDKKNHGRFYDKIINELFPARVNNWYLIFLLYNNFDSKREINNFLGKAK